MSQTLATRTLVLAAVMCVLGASGAIAQEKGQFGVTMTYPASAGLIWHATDRIAVRTTVGFSHTNTEAEYSEPFLNYPELPGLPLPVPSYSEETSTTNWAFSFSGLFYLSHADGVSTYVSPRYSLNYASTRRTLDVEYGKAPSIGEVSEESATSDAFGGFFGVQYAPNRRFSMFAEVGVQYTSRDDDVALLGRLEASATSTVATVGVTLYLGK